MKLMLSLFALLLALSLRAQTKVFKEVGEDISTQVKTISQDNVLVGYLAFTRLEKTSADSFNYRLTIMDENLNDIGAVNFRQGALDLQSVSFGQDVLCLGYVQRTGHIVLQFVNLQGNILNTWTKEAHVSGTLKYGMQIRNIPNGGFAFFYGDDLRQELLLFDTKGMMTHEQPTPAFAEHFYLHSSATELYLLAKQNGQAPEGGWKLYVFSPKDLSAENDFDLRDVNGNWLKVLNFDNDPATGDPYIAGCIINPRREKQFFTANDYAYSPYLGLFTLDLGNAHKDMYANCSYWFNDNIPDISAQGMFKDKGFYVKYATAFRDYKGNTIFAGTALLGKGYVGSAKYKLADGVFVRQDPTGHVVLDNDIPCDETKYFGDAGILFELDKKTFYKVDNPDIKNNYVIINDDENIYLYNVGNKKVMRTIPHKDGNIKINVYPAKEGHMMISEYNRKGRYTRFSIEAL